MSRIPNLFIIGSMKSGTSSLHEYIDTHPEIFMSVIKEPMHFSQSTHYGTEEGRQDYAALFESATDEKYVGESSTEYTKLPRGGNIPQRIYDFNPEARLIYIMRDPFERVVSNYKHLVKSNLTTLKLYDALQDEPQELLNSYFAYQLKPYIEVFGRAAVYVDTFEAMIQDPKDFCKRLFGWLGVDDSFVPTNCDEVMNATPPEYVGQDFSGFGANLLKRAKANPVLRKLVPMSISRKIRQSLSKPVYFDFQSDAFKQEIESMRPVLDPMLVTWIQELQELTGRSYSQWKTMKRNPDGPPEDREQTVILRQAVDAIIEEATVASK